jgi:ABC-type multidrug transport system fused ATPase/permease subunit
MEFTESALEWLRERLSAPVYAVFFFTSIAWNFGYLYALFLEDKIPEFTSRYEYAKQYAYQIVPEKTGFLYLDVPIHTLIQLFAVFFVPAVLTYLSISWLPYIHVWAHRRGLKFHFLRRGEFDKQRNTYERNKVQQLKELRTFVSEQRETTENIAQEKEAQQIAEKRIEGEDQWEHEFNKISTNKGKLEEISSLKRLVYSGRSPYTGEMESLAYLHLLKLFEIPKDGKGTLVLTPKGEYFMKRFLELTDGFK